MFFLPEDKYKPACIYFSAISSFLFVFIVPKITTDNKITKIIPLKLNNLSVVDLDHNALEFLYLRGLLDKKLIKPLYLS